MFIKVFRKVLTIKTYVMEKLVSFVIANMYLVMFLGLVLIIFLCVAIYEIKESVYGVYRFHMRMFHSPWKTFGMLFMGILFVVVLIVCIHIAPMLGLSDEGQIIVAVLSTVYLVISCIVTESDLWDWIF